MPKALVVDRDYYFGQYLSYLIDTQSKFSAKSVKHSSSLRDKLDADLLIIDYSSLSWFDLQSIKKKIPTILISAYKLRLKKDKVLKKIKYAGEFLKYEIVDRKKRSFINHLNKLAN